MLPMRANGPPLMVKAALVAPIQETDFLLNLKSFRLNIYQNLMDIFALSKDNKSYVYFEPQSSFVVSTDLQQFSAQERLSLLS